MVDGGAELQGPETATSVKSGTNGGAPVVVDGPFSEAKENVGGFSIIDVPNLDAAIAIVKEWPSLGMPASQSRSAHRRSQWRYVTGAPESANHAP
jgi:hypothetical protein